MFYTVGPWGWRSAEMVSIMTLKLTLKTIKNLKMSTTLN
jgi:hypothetical protein